MPTELNRVAELKPSLGVAPTVEPKPVWPDHTTLPYRDGNFAKTFQEFPQSFLLTQTVLPRLTAQYPNGHYCIGQDSGIYWSADLDPMKCLAVVPDWFLVVGPGAIV